MAKYLLKVNYTPQGTKGLLKDGGERWPHRLGQESGRGK